MAAAVGAGVAAGKALSSILLRDGEAQRGGRVIAEDASCASAAGVGGDLPLGPAAEFKSGRSLREGRRGFHIAAGPARGPRGVLRLVCAHAKPPRLAKEVEQAQSSAEPAEASPGLIDQQPLRRALVSAIAAASLAISGFSPLCPPYPPSAMADLNKYEAATRGEFGVGSAAQFGSADLRGTKHRNENFRRANFTSADMRGADFSGSFFTGAYLEKAVAYQTNFEGADLSDTLMDRMVLNEANLRNALLIRAVLTRSDLGDAKIDGADFSDAVLDLPMKMSLCKYASGVNPVSGMSTRESLGCGNKRRNAYGTPSAPVLSAPPERLLDKDGFCDKTTGKCDATDLS